MSSAGLADWGVQFVGHAGRAPESSMEGRGYAVVPTDSEAAESDTRTQPGYYADYLSVPGHPEYDGRFNCVTEIL